MVEPVSAQFIDVYYPSIDGVVRTVHNYAELLNQYSYCCVVAPSSTVEYHDDFPYDVFRTKSMRLPFVDYVGALPDLDRRLHTQLKQRKFDIFHAHSPFPVGKYGVTLARELDIPVVATFHSKYYDDFLRLTKSKTIARGMLKDVVHFYHSVDQVWAVSSGTADTLHEYGYKGEIFVMTNGTDYQMPDDPENSRQLAAERFDILPDKNILLFVGHQVWQKNLRLVLDTMRILADNSDDYLLLVVGDGYAADDIQAYAEKLRLDKCVRFVGKIADSTLMQGVMLNAQLFFFPSVYDNTPLVVREAAAMGVPSLLVRGSNAAEIVVHGDNGFVAGEDATEMAAEIERIFAHPAERENAGLRARQTIPVSWASLIPRVLTQYRQVIADYQQKK